MDNHQMIKNLKKAGISFAPGMSVFELGRAETVFGFRFPKEIREFLSCGIPVGGPFFNFNDISEHNQTRFQRFQESIVESFEFDLKNNRKTMQAMLGDKLEAAKDADSFDEAVIRYFHESVRLIPFYAHRCFFDGMDNMPIVSFWQPSDTIFYGGTFENYLEHEFLNGERVLENIPERMRGTGIWYDLIW